MTHLTRRGPAFGRDTGNTDAEVKMVAGGCSPGITPDLSRTSLFIHIWTPVGRTALDRRDHSEDSNSSPIDTQICFLSQPLVSHRGCVRAGSIAGACPSDRDPAEAREIWTVESRPLIASEFLMKLEAWLALSCVYTYGFIIIFPLHIRFIEDRFPRQRRPAGCNTALLNTLRSRHEN